MSEGKGTQLWLAQHIARDAVALLTPYTQRIEVAGSIRRGNRVVGDIDLIAIPKTEQVVAQYGLLPVDDLLQDSNDLLASFIHNMDEVYNPQVGSTNHSFILEGVTIEVYTVDHPDQWAALKLVRTGPWEFSKAVMTLALYKHYHFHDYILHMHEKGGKPGKRTSCKNGRSCMAIAKGLNEKTLFSTLEMPYILPEARDREIINRLVGSEIGVEL